MPAIPKPDSLLTAQFTALLSSSPFAITASSLAEACTQIAAHPAHTNDKPYVAKWSKLATTFDYLSKAYNPPLPTADKTTHFTHISAIPSQQLDYLRKVNGFTYKQLGTALSISESYAWRLINQNKATALDVSRFKQSLEDNPEVACSPL